METEMKEIIKEKEYVHDENRKEYASKSVGNAALATGIIGTALGAAAIWGRGRGFGIGSGMPENVNINTVSDAVPVWNNTLGQIRCIQLVLFRYVCGIG